MLTTCVLPAHQGDVGQCSRQLELWKGLHEMEVRGIKQDLLIKGNNKYNITQANNITITPTTTVKQWQQQSQ